MRETNLNGVDLNLLPPLHALVTTRNVTRAAQAAGISQPAMSRALARLRLLLNDPLLVRVSGGYALTPRGEGLAALLPSALAQVRQLLAPPAFDPASAERVVRIAGSDAQALLFGPPLIALLAREAPGLSLVIEPYRADILARMERGDIDLAFALAATALPPTARSLALGRDSPALVTRRGHPHVGRWEVRDYAAARHVTVAIFGDGVSEVDALLATHGLSRRIAFTTPSLFAALQAVAASDCVTTLSRRLASAFAGSLGLDLHPPPLAMAVMEPVLVWSKVKDGDPLLIWLRQHIATLGARTMPRDADIEARTGA